MDADTEVQRFEDAGHGTFSCNMHREVWPRTHWGRTPHHPCLRHCECRIQLRGMSEALDAIVDVVLLARPEGGRFEATRRDSRFWEVRFCDNSCAFILDVYEGRPVGVVTKQGTVRGRVA